MQQRAAGGRHGCHPESMTSYQKYPAKFHPDLILNDGALGFLKSVAQQEQEQEKQND